jgi:molybdate transport system substrate-binding protein
VVNSFKLTAGIGVLAAGALAIVWLAHYETGAGPAAAGRRVRVAAAADLQFALSELREGFGRAHPETRIEITYGSSGNFFAQLSNRAPFDVYLSADMEYPRRLVDLGLAENDRLFSYAVGHLVIWVPRSSPLAIEKLGAKVLLEPTIRKIAIANPRHAPYGRAAEAALKGLGIYAQVKDRLVLGDNVAQTAQFVQTGAADAGLIALSLALAPTLREEGHYWEIPPTAYPPLEQGGVILSWAEDPDAARALRDFILSGEGKAVLRRYGFHSPGD